MNVLFGNTQMSPCVLTKMPKGHFGLPKRLAWQIFFACRFTKKDTWFMKSKISDPINGVNFVSRLSIQNDIIYAISYFKFYILHKYVC